jgi:hypothetical protein
MPRWFPARVCLNSLARNSVRGAFGARPWGKICEVLSKTFRATIAAKNFHNPFESSAAPKRRTRDAENKRDLFWFGCRDGRAGRPCGVVPILRRSEERGAVGLFAVPRLRPKCRWVLDGGTLSGDRGRRAYAAEIAGQKWRRRVALSPTATHLNAAASSSPAVRAMSRKPGMDAGNAGSIGRPTAFESIGSTSSPRPRRP